MAPVNQEEAEYQCTDKLDETVLAGETELERMSLNVLFQL